MSHGVDSGYKMTSINRRFSYLLIGIVTILLLAFSAIVVFYHIRGMEADLNTRLGGAISFAEKSLPAPLWNLDDDVVSDVIDALFLDESVVYAKIYLNDRTIIEKFRREDPARKNRPPGPDEAGRRKSLIAREAGIFYEDNKVGTILIKMTRGKHRRQLIHQIYGITALTVVIISAIWITTLLISRRYITNPLKNLQDSASKIAVGIWTPLSTSAATTKSECSPATWTGCVPPSKSFSRNCGKARTSSRSTAGRSRKKWRTGPRNWNGRWPSSRP